MDLVERLHNVNNGKYSISERFWAKVMPVTESGCWLWVGGSVSGYGVIIVKNKPVQAHRLSYEMHKGPISKGLLVCHHCDIRCCVNPNHLFTGTYADNNHDRDSKGRHVRHSLKLTEEQVEQIKSRATIGTKKNPGNCLLLAKEYGVTRMTIYDIIKGRRRGAV